MNLIEQFGLTPAKAICYSGFRDGQQPGVSYPSYDEVKEDLLLLQPHWKYLRMYDCDEHARTVLDVIRNEQMDFKLMLGAYIEAESVDESGQIPSDPELATMTQVRALHEVVPVDISVPGCPPDPDVIFYVLSELAQGRKPELKDELLHWH